jgi:hypothetical protein
MRAWLVVIVVIVASGGAARAQPSTAPSAFEACTVTRKARMAEAMRIDDLDDRARALVAIPQCRREPDGTTAVVDPTAHEPEPPWQPRVRVALVAGVAASTIAYQVRPATGYGPALELAADWHRWRRFSLSLSAGYVGFDDGSYLGSYDVRHHFADLGARVALELGRASVGAGVGVQLDDAIAFADIPGHHDLEPAFELVASYEIDRTRSLAVILLGGLTFVTSSPMASDLSYSGDVATARLAIGIRR